MDTTLLRWSGSDALSGIASYTLEYRAQAELDWAAWVTNTTELQTFFTPPNPAEIYEFRIIPTDVAGNRLPADAPPSPTPNKQFRCPML
ncbi:MAG: hypothetical protein R3D55_19610 [Chloroflexota bacterium]